MEYFISDGSKTIGPFSKEQLKQKGISGSTLIYTEDTNWIEAKMIPDLADVIRKLPPPPPPPKQNYNQNQSEEIVYHTATNQTGSPKSKSWLYSLLVVLGLTGGGGFMYQQHTQTQQLQDEVRSREMQRQEEQARAEREKKRQELLIEKQNLRARIASLQTELSVHQDKLNKAQEWQFLRTADEREGQIRIINTNMRNIENAIRECNEKLEELESMNL